MEASFDEAHVAGCMERSRAWRNTMVAETDVEVARIGIPTFESRPEYRRLLREPIHAGKGICICKPSGPYAGGARAYLRLSGDDRREDGGDWAVGAVARSFRLSPMSAGRAWESIYLSTIRIVPEFRPRHALMG